MTLDNSPTLTALLAVVDDMATRHNFDTALREELQRLANVSFYCGAEAALRGASVALMNADAVNRAADEVCK